MTMHNTHNLIETNLIFIHFPLLHGSLAKASDIRALFQSLWISITLLQAVQLQVKEKKINNTNTTQCKQHRACMC